MPECDPFAWQRAVSMAARFHHGQMRKDGKTPYAAHPFRVAMTVRQVFDCEDEIALCAALLHDVIEDTPADYDDVADAFGPAVADIVAALTKDMRRSNHVREEQYDLQLAAAVWQAKLIKLADTYDNIVDCLNPTMRSKAVAKAHRAIELAGDEPRLAKAVAALRELIAHFK